jgi:hypothetical protein
LYESVSDIKIDRNVRSRLNNFRIRNYQAARELRGIPKTEEPDANAVPARIEIMGPNDFDKAFTLRRAGPIEVGKFEQELHVLPDMILQSHEI